MATSTVTPPDPTQSTQNSMPAPAQQTPAQPGTQPGAQPSATAPAGTPKPGTPQQPVILTPAPKTGFRGMLDRVLDAISGTTAPKVYTDQSGQPYKVDQNLTTGQKVARVLQLGIGGAANGWAAGKGAGNMGKAAAAGVQTGTGIEKGWQDQEQTAAEQVQKRKIDAANLVLLQQQIARGQFMATQEGREADDWSLKYAAEQKENLPEGSTELGKYTFDDLHKVLEKDPDFWKHHYDVDGSRIEQVKHFNQNGKADGVEIYLLPANVNAEMMPSGTTFKMFSRPTKFGDPAEMTEETSSEPMSRLQLRILNNTAEANQSKYQDEVAKVNASNQLANQRGSKAGEEDARADNLANGGSGRTSGTRGAGGRGALSAASLPLTEDGEIDTSKVPPADLDLARRYARGDMSVQDIVGRGSADQRKYWNELAQAVDPTFTTQRYKTRQNMQTDYASPTGKARQSIISFNQFAGHLQSVSDGVNSMRNTSSPWINTPINKLITQAAGDPRITQQLAPIIAARTEFESFLNGNHAIKTGELEDAKKLLNENMSPAQLQTAARSMAETSAKRLDELNETWRDEFGENYKSLVNPRTAQTFRNFGLGDYVNRWGMNNQQQNPQQPQAAPAGAAGTMKFSDGKTYYVDANHKPLGVAQ